MRKYIVITGTLFFICSNAFGQCDFQWWPLVNISKKTTHFKFFMEDQIRFRNNASEVYVIYSDIGLLYVINNKISIGSVYRPWWNKADNTFELYNRIMLEGNYKSSFHAFEYSYRARYQYLIKTNTITKNEHYWRNKFDIKYSDCKIKPFLSVELFLSLFKTSPCFVDIARYALGAEFSVTRKSSFIPLFMYVNNSCSVTYHNVFVIGGGYYLKL